MWQSALSDISFWTFTALLFGFIVLLFLISLAYQDDVKSRLETSVFGTLSVAVPVLAWWALSFWTTTVSGHNNAWYALHPDSATHVLDECDRANIPNDPFRDPWNGNVYQYGDGFTQKAVNECNAALDGLADRALAKEADKQRLADERLVHVLKR